MECIWHFSCKKRVVHRQKLRFSDGLGGYEVRESRTTQFTAEDNELSLVLKIGNQQKEIFPWYEKNEQIYYFFLPSCVLEDKIYFDQISDEDISIDDKKISKYNCFSFEQGKIYKLSVNGLLYQAVFMRGKNIPTFFVETKSGNMEYIHSDKGNMETGNITVVDASRHIQYSGKLDEISGRGNSTWLPFKKSYSIKLPEKYPICGLNSGSKWKLLSLYFEHDKMHSKIIFDMSALAGLNYTPECTWINLYCNGSYQGLYLLAESVDAHLEEDGCLLEKGIPSQLQEDEVFFITKKMEYLFKMKQKAGENVEEIAGFIQEVENLLSEGNSQFKEYLDIDSIASQFLIDKIVMEADAMMMSTFFYIRNGVIYAGPMWDYDRAVGEILPDYEMPVEGAPNGMSGWYMVLYNDMDFYESMINTYKKLLPYFEELLNGGIDYYAEWIESSVEMDNILMKKCSTPNETSSYTAYESYVKYLKYFLANRLNFLNKIWEIDGYEFKAPAEEGKYHQVALAKEDGSIIETRSIMDGECLTGLPESDKNYDGWYFSGRKGCIDKIYNDKIPIYEDLVLYAKRQNQ